jgi:hypothetical protein
MGLYADAANGEVWNVNNPEATKGIFDQNDNLWYSLGYKVSFAK